jgi:hypothetical protein
LKYVLEHVRIRARPSIYFYRASRPHLLSAVEIKEAEQTRFAFAFAVGSRDRRATALRHARSQTRGSRQRPFGFHPFSGGYQAVIAFDKFTPRT